MATLPAVADDSDDHHNSEPGLLLARMPLDTRGRRQPSSADELPQELLDAIHNPAVLENGLPYINTAWASNDMVDSYGTRMRPSSLRNYADDAQHGIALQNSHHVDELPLGRTFAGHFKAGRNPHPARTEMQFFIPPGLNVSGINTSDVIKAIDYGSVRDVSIGFYGGELRCSLDGKRMMGDLLSLLLFGGGDDEEKRDPNAPCNHLPGVEYAVRDANGVKTGETAIAVGEVEGAHCAELSLVFDGATPMAQIAGRSAPVLAKAYRMAEMDVLPKEVALSLESRYRGVRFGALTSTRVIVGGYSGGRAEWDTAYVNSLPDSAFAYIEPGGKKDEEGKTTPRSLRHFPHHDKSGKLDLPHLRNALARAEQTPLGDKAKPHLEKHAKDEGIGDRVAEVDLTGQKQETDDDRAKKRPSPPDDEENLPVKATDANPDPDGDGDDDRTPDGDTDHSHFNPDGSPKKTKPAKEKRAMSDDHTANPPAASPPAPPPAGSDLPVPAADSGSLAQPNADQQQAVLSLRSALVQAGLAPEGFVGDLAMRFNEIGREMTDLRAWADVGRQARERLVDECRKEGVRAFGAKFSESAYAPTFTRGSYKELQDLHAHLADLSATRFQGGRATQDNADPAGAGNTNGKSEPRRVPSRAFRA